MAADADPDDVPGAARARNAERRTATAPAMVTDDDVAHLRRARRRAAAALAGRLVAAGVGKGARVGLLVPNGIDWAVTAVAVMRIGAVLVPLSTLLRPPELEAQLRTAGVDRTSIAAAGVPRPPLPRRARRRRSRASSPTSRPVRRHPRCPTLRHVWPLDALPDDAVADDARRRRSERPVRPADDLVVLFTSGSRGTPKGVDPHPRRRAPGDGRRASTPAASAPGERLYIPMPFFWTGGFGSGLLSVLVAGATLLTEADPTPARPSRFLERERVDAVPGLARPGRPARRRPGVRRRRPVARSAPAASPPCCRPTGGRRPGARANLFGMTETFGPYCGARLDTDLPADERGQLRPAVRRRRGPHRRPRVRRARAPPASTGEICVRGPQPHARRSAAGPARPRSTPTATTATGDLGRARRRRLPLVRAAGSTTCSRSRAPRSTRPRSRPALRSVDVVRQAYVTDVADADGGAEVGALVVDRRRPLDEIAAGGRGPAERVQGARPAGCVTATAGDVPDDGHRQGRQGGAAGAARQREGTRTMTERSTAW